MSVAEKTDNKPDRGFHEGAEEDEFFYVCRDGAEIALSGDDYSALRVVEDFVNRLLFVNTMDIKKSLDGGGQKKPPRK